MIGKKKTPTSFTYHHVSNLIIFEIKLNNIDFDILKF